MKNRLVSKRYAEAYVAFASPKVGVSRCVEDMKDIRTVLRQNPDFLHFLRAPEVSKDEKAGLLDRVLGEVLVDETRTFIKYLIEKSRVSLLSSVAEYVRVAYSHGDVVGINFPGKLHC